MATRKSKVYQLKITLEGASPPIWRRVLIESSRSLSELHWIIQISMGWENSHLHHFMDQGEFYSEPSPFDNDMMDTLNSDDYQISQLLKREKDWIRYEYDFGDGWLHKITLEKVLPADEKLSLPQCVKGKRACPPEDCGGIWGYEDLLDILADKKHEDYQERLDWLGGEFDPEAFDLDGVNKELARWTGA